MTATILEERKTYGLQEGQPDNSAVFSAIQTIHTHFKGKIKLDLAPKSKLDVFVSGDRMTDFKEWFGK